jgi:hypothetical protein
MAMSEMLRNITKEDWRILGYYYGRDDDGRRWTFIGSKNGLRQFCVQLEDYASRARNHSTGAHDHWGPYMYLTIATSDVPAITKDNIRGSVVDLQRMSELVKRGIQETAVGGSFVIGEQYCSDCEYRMQFCIKEYGFDPAVADEQLWAG